jgi:hypothetical protein
LLQQVSCSRGNPAGEWLQAALALSIEIFFEEIPRAPAAIAEGPAVSTDRSGVTSEPGAVHILRIESCVRVIAPYPRRLGRRTEAAEGPGFPLMTQLAKPAGAEVG